MAANSQCAEPGRLSDLRDDEGVTRLLGNLFFRRWARNEVAAGRGKEAAEGANVLRRAALDDAYRWLMRSQADAVDRWKAQQDRRS